MIEIGKLLQEIDFKQKNFKNIAVKSSIFLLLAAMFIMPVNAALQGTGPINATNGYPIWYRDANGTALELQTAADLPSFGIAAEVDLESPFSRQINFGEESFWWSAEASIPGPDRILLVLATEAAFFNPRPADGDQQAFGRIRVRIDSPPVLGTYKVTHPYGVEFIEATQAVDPLTGALIFDPITGLPVIDRIFFTEDIGCIINPGIINRCSDTVTDPTNPYFGKTFFSLAEERRAKPFLTWDTFNPNPLLSDPLLVNPANNRTHVGRADIPHAIKGSPLGTNFFRVEGPPGSNLSGTGSNVIETNLFFVTGKIAVDRVPPVITVSGLNPVYAVIGSAYVDAGATALDDFDGNITANIVTTGLPINTSAEGIFNVTYTVADAAGNSVSANRTVNVVAVLPADTTPPAITVIGRNPINITIGTAYNDPGASAFDNFDGNITANITATGIPISTSQVGSFTINYTATDAANNTATAARRVNVILPRVGPVNPVNGYPVWYKDTNGLALEMQTVADSPNFGIASPVDPANLLSVAMNFGPESFWWSADSDVDLVGGKAILVLAAEAAFVTENPTFGEQQAFGRIRVRMAEPPVAGIYKITHPYGVEFIEAIIDPDTGQPDRMFYTRDAGCFVAPGLINNCNATIVDPSSPYYGQTYFSLPLSNSLWPFLTWDTFNQTPEFSDPLLVNPANNRTHVGRLGVRHNVTGSPFGTNFFRIEGPPGSVLDPIDLDNVVETTLFQISGKVYNLPPVVADTIPPLLIVTQPIDGQIFATNSITVTGIATDASNVFSVTVNGNPVTVSPTGIFSTTVILAPGANTVTINATDASPNANTATVTAAVTFTPPVVADTIPPLLIVTQPIDGQIFATNSITVSGTATDASNIFSVTVNGNPVTVSPTGTFTAAFILAPGANTLTINATDASPNANTAIVSSAVTFTPPVVADTTPPLLIVTQPIDGQIFATNSITVSGTATDASNIFSVTVNGNPVTVSPTGTFTAAFILAPGANTLTINATDTSTNANTATATRTITFTPSVADRTRPLLIVTQPIDGSTVTTNSITVSGTATDPGGIFSVAVNGNPVTVSPTGTFTTTVILTTGRNTITITATDASANFNPATVTRRVTYTPTAGDITPPLLIVNQPVDGSTFAANSITVSGTATDPGGIFSIAVNGNPVTVDPTGSFSATVILAAGRSTITVTATDASTNANTATTTRRVTYSPTAIDTTPPLLIVNQPVDGQTITTNSITVGGTAVDPSGIFSVTVNGNPVTVSPTGSFSTTVFLINGINTITVTATDSSTSANTISVTRRVTYSPIVGDISPPLLIVNQPVDGSTFSTNSITVSGTATDASGISSVAVNGNTVAVSPTGSFSTTVILASGGNTITVAATDASQNANTVSLTRRVTYSPAVVDTIPPLLLVSQPVDGSTFATSSITVSGTATDSSGIFSVAVNGNPVTVDATGSFSTTVILASGRNTITVAAVDASVNANRATVTRRATYSPTAVDTTPPLLLMAQPVDGSTFATNSIIISGTATDASGISSVSVNGNPVTVSPTGGFSTTVILASGRNTITISAKDASPNANAATLTRRATYTPAAVDTLPPLLIVNQPVDGSTFATSSITVSGTATDSSGIFSVSVNGNPVTVDPTGAFSTTVILSSGTNTITVSATDASQNANTATVRRSATYTPAVVDVIPPLLIVTQPVNVPGTAPLLVQSYQQNVQNFVTSSITVSGYVTDSSGVRTVTVNGAPATITGDSFSYTLVLNPGTNTIEVEAIDGSGNDNRATVTRTATYTPQIGDTVPPALIVNQPANGQNFAASLITVSGTATDTGGIHHVSVNGDTVAVSPGTFSTNIYLAEGPNTIKVEAEDSAGNTAEITRRVTYTPGAVDTTPPSLTLNQPANGESFSVNPITVSGTAYDSSGIYSVIVNGNAVSRGSTGSFSTTVYLTEGSNTITITATDARINPNTATVTRTVTYTPAAEDDTAPPVLVVDRPTSGGVFTTGSITVGGRATDDSGVRSVTVNGVPVILTPDGRFGISIDPDIGSNAIVVQAIDSSSNLNINTTTLTVNRAIPPATEQPELILRGKMEDTTLIIAHSPRENTSVEINGGVGSVRTSTEIAMGITNGTRISYSIGASTIDSVISNPIIVGDTAIFTVDNIMLNNSRIESNFTGIGTVSSDVDVAINNNSALDGMRFAMSLHSDIADDLTARGKEDVLTETNKILANLGSSLGIAEIKNRIAFVTSAQLEGAGARDIHEVMISMTVRGDWYRSMASSTPGNVHLAKIYDNGTVGMIESPRNHTYDQVNDRYTFEFSMKGFSSYVLVGITPVRSATGAGGGGGFGGAGVTTSEPLENVEKAEGLDKSLISNIPVAYDFNSPEHSIYRIMVTGMENEAIIAIRVEALKGTSKLVASPAPGIVYRNVNIWAGTKRIKEASIRFRVDNAWLESNTIAGSDVKMQGWDGSRWLELETKEIKKEGAFTSFEAKTGALSILAITGVKGIAGPAETRVEITETPARPTGTAASTPGKPESTSGFEVMLVIAAFSALYIFGRKRR